MSYTLTGSTFTSALPPPGSLAAYLASTDPFGWVICDGVSRGITDGRYVNVVTLAIGSTAGNTMYTPPNLRGTFLRGTGTAPNTTFVGPALGTTQGQQIINHGHTIPGHSHSSISSRGTTYYILTQNTTGNNTVNNVDSTANEINLVNPGRNLTTLTTGSGVLTRNNSVSTSVTSGTETRPYNYGVNWILKL